MPRIAAHPCWLRCCCTKWTGRLRAREAGPGAAAAYAGRPERSMLFPGHAARVWGGLGPRAATQLAAAASLSVPNSPEAGPEPGEPIKPCASLPEPGSAWAGGGSSMQHPQIGDRA